MYNMCIYIYIYILYQNAELNKVATRPLSGYCNRGYLFQMVALACVYMRLV